MTTTRVKEEETDYIFMGNARGPRFHADTPYCFCSTCILRLIWAVKGQDAAVMGPPQRYDKFGTKGFPLKPMWAGLYQMRMTIVTKEGAWYEKWRSRPFQRVNGRMVPRLK